MLSHSTGYCVWYRTIPRLFLLLHNPTRPTLPLLFCWPASWGKNRLGKGRQRRMYPTSVKNTPIQYPGKKMPEQLSCGFQLLLFRHFSLLEEMMWFTSLPPSSPTLTSPLLASYEGSVNERVCVFLVVLLHTFDATHSRQRWITSRPLLRVRDHTTAQATPNRDLTVPSNMSWMEAISSPK